MTFNQLLAKYGYIEEESMVKKERNRPWQIKKISNTFDSDSDSD